MRKVLLLSLLILSSPSFAKMVKFSVDMDTNTINVTGIHVMGDFQAIAGFPGGDWQPNTTVLIQQGTSTIYSTVLDIPAFTKYEYRFVNGDQSYETEFVPVESRVGYNFIDNRWLWVDSLANDTTDVGAILFSGNAPAGLTLVRFLVDMQNAGTLSAAGIHIAGNYQGWNPATVRLYSFGSNIYEIINYVTTGTYEYKYYNGNIAGTDEVVPATCAVSNNRQVVVTHDTILSTVCFASCSACSTTGIEEKDFSKGIALYPNPAQEFTELHFADLQSRDIEITDVTGRSVRRYADHSENSLRIESSHFNKGIYFIRITGSDSKNTLKLIVE